MQTTEIKRLRAARRAPQRIVLLLSVLFCAAVLLVAPRQIRAEDTSPAATSVQAAATSAQVAATSAQTSATSLQAAATSAQAVATSAQAVATSAQATATSLQAAATSAQVAATSAQVAATSAQTSATSLQAAATSAQAAATAAQAKATSLQVAATAAQAAATLLVAPRLGPAVESSPPARLAEVAAQVARPQSAPLAAPSAQAAGQRKRVGLALGGGAALGWAHIGVLEALEENRIPVDMIAGTSSGAIVGGLYAAGMTPNEIGQMFKEQDWYDNFLGEPQYRDMPFRRKEEKREFSNRLRMGLRGGLPHFPGGLDPAHPLGLLFSRHALAYTPINSAADLKTFDDLVTPFRSVSVDLATGHMVVPHEGSFPLALRASMAVPLTFTPVILNARTRTPQILVDGGVLDNVPTDIAQTGFPFQPDLLVAVKLDQKTTGLEDIDTLVGILTQSVNVMQEEQYRHNPQPQVLILPDLTGFGTTDYEEVDALAKRGHAAAMVMMDRLRPFQLTPKDWAIYQADREKRRRRTVPIPRFVIVTGDRAARNRHDPAAADPKAQLREEAAAEREARRRENSISNSLRRYVNRDLTPLSARQDLERDLNRIAAEGRYSNMTYEMTRRADGKYGLLVHASEISYGPPFLNFGGDAAIAQTTDSRITLKSRLTMMDIAGFGSEARIDASLGSSNALFGEFYAPLPGRHWFVAPHVRYSLGTRNLFQDRAQIAEYHQERYGIGMDLGLNDGQNAELRLGFDVGRMNSSLRVGTPGLPVSNGEENVASLRFVYDGQNSPTIPTKGLRGEFSALWYADSPDANRSFPKLEASVSQFLPVSRQTTLFVKAEGGTLLGYQAPQMLQFTLGGPFRLAAYREDELQGPKYLYFSAGYLHLLHSLPSALGGRLFFTAFYEVGSAFEESNRARYLGSASVGLMAETAVGPVFAGASFGESDHHVFYVTLGRTF